MDYSHPKANSAECSSNTSMHLNLNVLVEFICSGSTVSITFDMEYFNENLQNKFQLDLPKPWGVQKGITNTEEVLIFTYIVEDGIDKHVFEKTVLIKSSREIIYEVYSRIVHIEMFKLPNTLENFGFLSEILKKFKDVRIYKGVTDIISVRSQTYVLKTCTGIDIRHKDCPLVSANTERCPKCKIYYKYYQRNLKKAKSKKMYNFIFYQGQKKFHYK